MRCSDCGLGYTCPALPASEIGAWYPEAYYGKENVRFIPVIEKLTHLFQWRRAQAISHLVPAGPVLDVGCGRGFLLKFLEKLGYESHGVELNENAAWYARNQLKLDVVTEDFLTLPLMKEHYAAIVFWHTLEHLANPIEIIARARELLRPGGLLLLAVPNSESLQARISGRFWLHLDIPRHYCHFGKKSLKKLLKQHNFRITQLDHFSLEQNPFGWLQSLFNVCRFNHNFLYSMLKNRSTRTYHIRKHLFQTLMTLVLLPIFIPLSLIMTVIETASRRGGTIEVYAIKED